MCTFHIASTREHCFPIALFLKWQLLTGWFRWMRRSGAALSGYRCVVISQRIFKRDVPGMKQKLEDNLTRLRAAAKKQHGFVKSQNYSLSPYLKHDVLERPSSIILSEWKSDFDWETWFNSQERVAISRVSVLEWVSMWSFIIIAFLSGH